MPEIEQREELLELTATIVEAHVSNNPIASADLPGLIPTVHETLTSVGAGLAATREPAQVKVFIPRRNRRPTAYRSGQRLGDS